MKHFSAFLCLFCSISVVLANENNANYVIGTENIEYYPHYGKSTINSNEFSGFAKDFFERFASNTDLSISYQSLPIERLYLSLLAKHQIDFKYPDNPNWQKALKVNHKIYYTDPIGQYIDGVFIHKDNHHFQKKDITHLGIIRGFTAEPFLNEIKQKQIILHEYTRSDNMISAILAKRLDAIYINIDVANYQLSLLKSESEALVFRKDLPFQKGSYHLSTVKYPAMISVINQFLKKNQALLNQLTKKYQLTTIEKLNNLN